ncbi:MAG TPA: DEAD/DEAH box helicase, partial [Jiangellales bacterium]|nr:DEAD/DEAH box helicase [Jiangellales bacterium]
MLIERATARPAADRGPTVSDRRQKRRDALTSTDTTPTPGETPPHDTAAEVAAPDDATPDRAGADETGPAETEADVTETVAAGTTFRTLGVLAPIAEALERVGIVEAFPIQEMTLPVALVGSDVIGQARTGTGKTLGFGIPLLQRIVAPDDRDYADLVEPGRPQALVVVPTRELAVQVSKDLQTASSVRRVRVLTVYGGRAYEPQVAALRSGVDVVVGTPGRLLDLMGQGELVLAHVKVLVLDEADEMLDLGFLPDVEKLVAATPELRQTMLFSATMPAAVVSLARRYMRHPLNVRAEAADDAQTVPATAQFVYRAHNLDKDEILARVLQAEGRGLAMIFCRTKRQAQRVADELDSRGFAAASVHGDLGQGAREQALRAFRSGKVDVLVATDVAARGIDVEGVTHVINMACPEDEKTYLHRIGRTGRAGASGVAVTLVDWDDMARWKMINTALDLPYPEPAETYSTSEDLYHDLGIPPGTTGVLPRAQQTRAGLDAEAVEDLGETGRGRRGGRDARGGRGGPGRGDRRDRGRERRSSGAARGDR